REKPLWPAVHGDAPHDLPDRHGGPHRPRLAQGESERPCRRGAGGRDSAVISLSEAIRAALLAGDPREKVMATRKLVRDWRSGRLEADFRCPMPDRPTWPAELELLPPNRMPRRGRGGSQRNAIALWHSLAHIEF